MSCHTCGFVCLDRWKTLNFIRGISMISFVLCAQFIAAEEASPELKEKRWRADKALISAHFLNTEWEGAIREEAIFPNPLKDPDQSSTESQLLWKDRSLKQYAYGYFPVYCRQYLMDHLNSQHRDWIEKHTTDPYDPFADSRVPIRYACSLARPSEPAMYISVGPDGVADITSDTLRWDDRDVLCPPNPNLIYDPTNGLFSRGDLFLLGADGEYYHGPWRNNFSPGRNPYLEYAKPEITPSL